jgi:hypothetical protein
MSEFNREQLERMGDKELKRMAVDMGCTGIYKKVKSDAIQHFLDWQSSRSEEAAAIASTPDALTSIAGSFQSTITKPDLGFGEKATTTITVSCGAATGQFDVVGRTVKEVGDLLREVLNIDKISTGLVNSRDVSPDTVLKQGDVLEFLKPAGRKG